jgi:hypothetical protein
LPPIVPGDGAGPIGNIRESDHLAVLTGHNTDIINIMYADNTLADVNGNSLNSYPITQASPSTPGMRWSDHFEFGDLATNCFHHAGNRANGSGRGRQPDHVHRCYRQRSGIRHRVSGQIISFGSGDPANLNGTGLRRMGRWRS